MTPRRLLPLVLLALGTPLSTAAADLTITDGKTTLGVADMRAELYAVPQAVRPQVAGNRAQLAKLATSVMSNMRAADEARAAGLDRSPEVAALLRKAERDALAKAYIDMLLAAETKKIPDMSKLAEEEYLVRKSDYEYPEAIRVAHILLKVDPEDPTNNDAKVKADAEELLAKLRDGGDFALLAKQRSEDKGSADKGGDLPGWVTRGRMVPPFEEAAFALQPGETSGLVRTRFGYHIIRLQERKPAGVKSFAEVKAQIIKRLRDQYLDRLRSELQLHFQGTRDVEVSDEFAKAVADGLDK